MIILFGGEKGGAGKTTLATNIAVLRSLYQPDTLLVDTDRQATASWWCSVREENNIEPRITSIQKYEKDIVVDAGGRDSPELRGALLVSHIAIFPLRPSQFDLWTLRRLSVLVETAKEINENLEAYVAVNLASPNPSVKEIEEMRELVKEFTLLKMLKTNIYERIVYRRAAIGGMGVIEYKPEDTKAVQEITNLYEELFGEINND